jgi:hypothetical protein
LSFPHSTVFKPVKVIGDKSIVPGGLSIDLQATVSGQPNDAFELPAPRTVVLTNKSAEDFVDVQFYAAGTTTTPTYGAGIAIPPGAQVPLSLPVPGHTRLGAVTDSGVTVALNVVCGHGI